MEAGYGIELDLHITADGYVVVYHDDDLERGCGIHGRIEDMSLSQVQALRLFGSDEYIPLFSQVLSLVSGKVPMIVEFKSSQRNRQLCQAALKLLRSYSGDYCIESFDPNIVAWFRFHAPDILRGQLSSLPHKLHNDMSPFKAFFVGRLLTNFMARPQFIAYGLEKKPLTVRLCEALGALRVCWTSLDARNEDKNDVVIFQFYRPDIKFK